MKHKKEERQLSLPLGTITKDVTVTHNLIIVGANGSGKTRLGAWIELKSPQKHKVHRISAQKSLSMPDMSSPMSLEKAEKSLLCGYEDATEDNASNYKQGHRWGNNPVTSLLSDFERLMVYLFSEHYEQSSQYLQAAKSTLSRVTPPETKIDIVKRIWEEILPHRELYIGGGTIKTSVKQASKENVAIGDGKENEPQKTDEETEDETKKAFGATYKASEMSDGERVIFYLIGQCLAAPKDGIIVIDEPELHIHKSVQVPLWNELEKCRSDCLFIYITHDIDFCASKESSVKLWLKSYDGNQWDWEIVEQVEGLPEYLLLEVLGSRKPVIFVEGDNGSYDVSLYRAVLRGFLVIPVRSCSQVIQSVKALRENNQLHHLEIFGIIDRDRRVDAELIALESSGVFALDVAEVENLFCTPEILSFVAKKLERDPTDALQQAEKFIFDRLNSELETQISLRSASEIKFRLNLFDDKSKGEAGLQKALSDLSSSINVPQIYADSKAYIEAALHNKDYKAVLRLYNRKSLASQMGGTLGLKKDELPEYVVRLAKGSSSMEISSLLKPYFGTFADKISSSEK